MQSLRAFAFALAGFLGLAAASAAGGGVAIEFNYAYDGGFFTGHPERQATLEFAGACLARFADDLDPIVPGGGNTWEAKFYRPDNGDWHAVSNPIVPADTLIVYAGGRDLVGSLGRGGPGGYAARGSVDWLKTVGARGEHLALEPEPTDFGPWGGQVAFTTAAGIDWYFGIDPAGLGAGQSDFLSVALHELAHVLGFGTADAWDTYVAGAVFTGPASVAAYGGNVPLQVGGRHWAPTTESQVDGATQEAAMDPQVTQGTRKVFTVLDFAGLDDVGWEVAAAVDAWAGAPGTAWSADGNWSEGVPPAASSTAVFDGPAGSLALDVAAGVRRIEFRSTGWTVSGAGTLTVYWGGADSAAGGVNTLTAPVGMGTASTWTVGADGTLDLAGGLNADGFALTKAGPGTLDLAAAANLGGLDVQAGTVRTGGGLLRPAGDLALAADATLDLTAGNLVLDYDPGAGPFGQVEAWVVSGYGGGTWDDTGIGSSTAAADGMPTALAVGDNADPLLGLADLEGEPLDPDGSDVLVRFTWYGDVNFDGVVDAADYAVMDQSWNGGSQSPAGGGDWRWACGDVNYDGIVDAADYALIDQVWNTYGGQTLDAGAPAPLDGTAPEPATLALLGAGLAALLRRRRA